MYPIPTFGWDGKSIGQALGYSLYGERCYLAVVFKGTDTFTKEQQYMAGHLGVGLIRIPIDNNFKVKRSEIEIVISSKKHKPILGQKQYLLNALGIYKNNY